MKDTLLQAKILTPPVPNSFAGLMEMYEANYIRIRKLCGDKNAMPEVAVSRIYNGMDLYLQVLEQTKYTSTLALTYYFADEEVGVLSFPNVKVRVYYDALQAEVMSQSYRRAKPDFSAFHHLGNPSLLLRWRMNRFLFKWLSFCNRQGHSFKLDDKSRQNHLLTKNVEIPLQRINSYSTIIE